MIEHKKLIEPLTLSVRTENPLKRAGIRTLAQLLAHSDQELLRLPFFGRKSLREIEEELANHGRSLRTTPTPRMQAAVAWRPIATAPQDRPLLFFGMTEHDSRMVRYRRPVVYSGFWSSLDEAWCAHGSHWDGPFFDPTHWQPLPEPPETAE